MRFKAANLTYWILAVLGIQVLLALGLALILGQDSPAHSTAGSVERRIYSAVDIGAFYVAISSPSILASIITWLVATMRRIRSVPRFVLGAAWPATPLLLFILSLNGPLLYLAILQSLAGIFMSRMVNILLTLKDSDPAPVDPGRHH
jgi:hypothetical protein